VDQSRQRETKSVKEIDNSQATCGHTRRWGGKPRELRCLTIGGAEGRCPRSPTGLVCDVHVKEGQKTRFETLKVEGGMEETWYHQAGVN